MTTSGYGLQSNLTTNQFLIFIFQQKETCLLPEVYTFFSLRIWRILNLNIWLYMVSYACKFLKLRHHLHSSFEEKRHREKKQCNTEKTE